MHFFKRYVGEVDVFCLQEVFDADQAELDRRHPDEHVRGDLFRKIAKELSGYEGHFAAFDDVPTRQSQAIFHRAGMPVKSVTDTLVYVPENPVEHGSHVISSRKMQHATIDHGGRDLMIANLHGLWNGGPKHDSPDRIEQSRRVLAAIEEHGGPTVLLGDFNLLPETESVAILEEKMTNLIRSHAVASTRTPLYRSHADPATPKHADYVMVTPDVRVLDFKVLPDIVSDHAALYLEIL